MPDRKQPSPATLYLWHSACSPWVAFVFVFVFSVYIHGQDETNCGMICAKMLHWAIEDLLKTMMMRLLEMRVRMKTRGMSQP